ncbi:MAG: tetratricopeptide repeat protein [Gammaproteobacteria bacterium]
MFASLVKRRVPQILGLYLGGCWVVIEFVSFLTERYLLSDALTDLTLVALFTMTPAVAAMAWFHGTPGKDPVPKFEKVLVPANALVTLALVGALFYGTELGATATEVTTVDETGQTLTRMAPKDSFRRSLALFFFDNPSSDPANEWLRYGLPIMLQRDLEQDAYVDVWSPLSGYEQSGMLSLQRAGFDNGLDAPLPLMRQIAQTRGMPVFITGEFSSSDGGYAVELTLHWTDNSQPPRIIAAQGRDPMEAIDVLTVDIKAALDVPSAARSMMQDLPLAEHFSSSVDAVEEFALATVAQRINNDTDAAMKHWLAAFGHDPTFSAAHLRGAMVGFNAGQAQQALPAIRAARQHDYKLLPDEKFQLKALEYSYDGQAGKVTSVYKTWAELYPDDIDALIQLGFSQLYSSNDVEESLATFNRVRERAPSEHWVLSQMARLHSVRGETDEALALLAEHSALRPQDYQPWLSSSKLRLASGDLAGARADVSRSVVMSSGRVSPVLALADLNLREGLYEEAQSRIDEAQKIANVPRQNSLVLVTQIDYFRDRGMLDELANTVEELTGVYAQYRNTINSMMDGFINYVEEYAAAGRDEVILDRLATYEGQLEPPINELVQVGYTTYHLAKGDLEKGRAALARVRGVIEMFNRDDMQYLVETGNARVFELEGNLPAAVAAMHESIRQYERSVQSVDNVRDEIFIKNTLAHYLMQNDQPDDARQVLLEVTALYPAHPVTNLRIAQIDASKGDITSAREHLAISLNAWSAARPDYAYLQEAVALGETLQP